MGFGKCRPQEHLVTSNTVQPDSQLTSIHHTSYPKNRTRPMQLRLTATLLVTAAMALGGCATQNSHLVYRDAKGAPSMQVDYPNAGFCTQVEAVAAGNVKCEGQSAAASLAATATLYYDPPGLDVI